MRRYDDPVEVRSGEEAEGPWGEQAPEQFLWRGRLWKVRAVLAHWVETGPWWQAEARGEVARIDDLLAERELWRVEAGGGRAVGSSGVFELARDAAEGSWQLVGCQD